MRKAIIYLMLFIFALVGFKGNSKASDISGSKSDETSEITFTEGVWANKDWANTEFAFEKDCVPDKEAAINTAESLIENFNKQNYFTNYVPQSVFYDTEDRIWIVTFAESGNYPGACVSIAIRKSNAEVVRMWIGE